jgi:hypothetical protein
VSCELGRLKALRGYWLLLQPSGHVTPLLCSEARCPGTASLLELNLSSATGAADVIPQCGPLRMQSAENYMCGQCLQGYQDIGGACKACASATNAGLLVALLAVALVFVLVIYLLEARQNNTGDLSVLLYFTQIALLIAGPSADWSSWVNILSLSSTGTDFFSGCVFKQGDVEQNLLMPLFALLIIYAVGAAASAVSLLLSRLAAARVKFDPNLQVRAALAVLLFSFTALLEAAFSSLECVDLGGSGGGRGSVLHRYPSISCQSRAYRAALGVQIAIIVLVAVGLPCAVLYLVREAHASLPTSKLGSYLSAPLPLSHAVRWGALYQPYTPAAHYYQAVVLVRRVLYSAFNIGLATQPQVRGVCLALLAVVCLVVQLLVKPYKNETLNTIESASLLLHIALAVVAMPWPKPYPLGVEVIVFLLIFIPSLLFFSWKAYSVLGLQCCGGSGDVDSVEEMEGGGDSERLAGPTSPTPLATSQPRVLHGEPSRPQQQHQQQQHHQQQHQHQQQDDEVALEMVGLDPCAARNCIKDSDSGHSVVHLEFSGGL